MSETVYLNRIAALRDFILLHKDEAVDDVLCDYAGRSVDVSTHAALGLLDELVTRRVFVGSDLMRELSLEEPA